MLAASIFHFGEVSIGEAKRAMAAAGHAGPPDGGRRMSRFADVLARLAATIEARKGADAGRPPTPPSCWPTRQRAAKKLGEEAVETAHRRRRSTTRTRSPPKAPT